MIERPQPRSKVRRLFVFALVAAALAGKLRAEDTPPPATAANEEASIPAVPPLRLNLNGREFHRVEAAESAATTTFVYLPEGSTTQDWAEMVTHQLLKLQQRAGADEVVQFIRGRSQGKIRIETILETRKAAVFISLAPGADGAEAQMAVGLAFLDLANPLQVHLVQFVLKPNRLPQAEVEQKLRSWRDLFKDRATALATN